LSESARRQVAVPSGLKPRYGVYPLTPALRLGLTHLPPTRLITPALRLGLVGTRPTETLALMAQQHEVVHVIYCQSLSVLCSGLTCYEITGFTDFSLML